MDKGEMRNSRVWSFTGLGWDRVGSFCSCCSGGAVFGVGNGDGAGNALMLWLLLCPRPKSRIPGVLARSPRSYTGTWPLFDVAPISVSIPDLLGRGLERSGITGGVGMGMAGDGKGWALRSLPAQGPV